MSAYCSKCGRAGKVIETRSTEGLIRRRRECCGRRWNTYEGGDDPKWEELTHKLNQYRQAIADIRAVLGRLITKEPKNE